MSTKRSQRDSAVDLTGSSSVVEKWFDILKLLSFGEESVSTVGKNAQSVKMRRSAAPYDE